MSLKKILSGALATLLFRGAESFNHERGHHVEHSCYMKLGPVVQEEMPFLKKFTNGRTDDGRRPITIARLEPSAQVS